MINWAPQEVLDSVVSLTELEDHVETMINNEYESYDRYTDPAEVDWDHAWQSAQDRHDAEVYGS